MKRAGRYVKIGGLGLCGLGVAVWSALVWRSAEVAGSPGLMAVSLLVAMAPGFLLFAVGRVLADL